MAENNTNNIIVCVLHNTQQMLFFHKGQKFLTGSNLVQNWFLFFDLITYQLVCFVVKECSMIEFVAPLHLRPHKFRGKPVKFMISHILLSKKSSLVFFRVTSSIDFLWWTVTTICSRKVILNEWLLGKLWAGPQIFLIYYPWFDQESCGNFDFMTRIQKVIFVQESFFKNLEMI